MARALGEFRVVGVESNIPLHQQVVRDPAFVSGVYDTRFMGRFQFDKNHRTEETRRDLAAIMAVAYAMRRRLGAPVTPDQVKTGWHRSARRLPN